MDDTIVLGISLSENASATLLKNGKIISHILRERISGIKNHYGVDYSTVQLCLSEAKCDVREVNYCALTATPGSVLRSVSELIEVWVALLRKD